MMSADRIRIWFMVSLLGILMLGSFWLVEVMRREHDSHSTNTKQRTEPDYFVEHFNFVRLSQSGQTNYRITGDKLTHYPEQDEYEITQPLIIGVDQEKTPMSLRAERAIVKQKRQGQEASEGNGLEDEIHLLDKVEVKRSNPQSGITSKLSTQALTLYPNSERMETAESITIQTPRSTITALGLEADNATQTIKFLHQLRVTVDNTVRPSLNKSNHN